jgi:4-amino-4-deoxy-L-arabinose transferase-like glycosyltransferase
MLEMVKSSESNPPLYYVLGWGWAKAFGTDEFGLRSLSALIGALTVPLGYAIGRELAGRRAGLLLTAMLAVNPMLIWYSQEARSYALLVLLGTLSLLFFLRALRTRSGRDLGLWALASALALCSHYFAFFAVGIEAVWLLVALRGRWKLVLPALAAAAAAGAALLPLIAAQVNPTHISWIEGSPLATRFWEAGSSFLIGETGHVIAEPPRDHYALVPVLLVGMALLLVLLRGSARQRRGAATALALGLGVVVLTAVAALAGRDYIVERNLLPALVPLAAAAAVGFAAAGARRLGLLLAVVLCAYWLAFDVHVTRTPNLQRPDFRTLAEEIGQPNARRAIVSWKLAADSLLFYLPDGALRMYGGQEQVEEVYVVSKPLVAAKPVNLPPSFHSAQRLRLDRLTLTRYVSRDPVRLWFHMLQGLPTGFGDDAVVIDGPRSSRSGLGARARTKPSLELAP